MREKKMNNEFSILNSIEERDNLIALLHEALKFYGKKENYFGNRNVGVCSGMSVSYIEMDEGSQARFALEKAEQIIKQNQNLQNEYNNLISGYEQLQANEEIAEINGLLNTFKIMSDDKDI